jgi:hypothetical protein
MSKPVALARLLDQLGELSDEFTIYVRETNALSSTTPAVAQEEPASAVPPPGMRYLVEVDLAKEGIATWSAASRRFSRCRPGRRPVVGWRFILVS